MIAKKGDVQYMLRLPDKLRKQVKKRADKNGRSMNTEIVAAIEEHLRLPDRFAAVASAVVELTQIVADITTHLQPESVSENSTLAKLQQRATDLEADLNAKSLCDPQ